jgi:transposase
LLHQLVRDLAARVEHRDGEIEKLRLIVRQLQRGQFGPRSERLDRDQLQLGIEDLDADIAHAETGQLPPAAADKTNREHRPRRLAFPEHLPREEVKLDLNTRACPGCGGALHSVGETISEMLDWVPASLRIIRTHRPKYGCRACGTIHLIAAPERLIAKGMATPGLIAQVLVSKYGDHMPLYRQARILARYGIELDRSTLANWVGGACWWLEPLHARLAEARRGTVQDAATSLQRVVSQHPLQPAQRQAHRRHPPHYAAAARGRPRRPRPWPGAVGGAQFPGNRRTRRGAPDRDDLGAAFLPPSAGRGVASRSRVLEVLHRIRRTIGAYNFASQCQQSPAPLGGGFKRYRDSDKPERFDRIVQSWDTANKSTELSDYSVCTTWGVKDKNVYLLGQQRQRLEYPALKRAVRDQQNLYRATEILIEDKASGTLLGRTPTGWIAPACLAHSFDDLVGKIEDRGRDRQPERFGGPQVNNQLEPCRLLNGQVGGLGALQDLVDVPRGQPELL